MFRIYPNHFQYCLLFAFFTSIVFGVVSQRTNGRRLEYGVYCFLGFLVALLVLGWLMAWGHG